MKRLVVVLSGLLVLPAFAEVAPSQYDANIVFSDVELNDVDTGTVETEVVEQTVDTNVTKPKTSVSGRVSSARNITRTTATRSGANRNEKTTSQRSVSGRSRVIGRSTTSPSKTTSVSTRRTSATGTTARSGVKARAATIIRQDPTYISANIQNGQRTSTTTVPVTISTRGASLRTATTSATTPTADTAAATTSELDAIKSLTEYCQAQYASCMDNYCNVLDDNQGRCSCSKNVSNYEKTEAALAAATEALQDVARSIQYIGLSADQITTLFTETEAELSMKDSKDNSAIRSDLDKVKRMILDVKSGTASATENDSTLSFDLSGLLDFTIDNAGFDLSGFLNTTGSSTNSISNQRGESLYKTATARCKASVLNSCTSQGVDAAMITNSYDLEIDKSCLAYERALTDSNLQMSRTVANAKEVLKKARLLVAQNKNSYDLRGCVSALESCMQDDYVCGNGYTSCLDPTGQYIVNGAVVVGSMPGSNSESQDNDSTHYSHDNLFATWEYNSKNPWVSPQDTTNYITLAKYIDGTVKSGKAAETSDKMSEYLQNKIGYHDNKTNKDYGMCMSVLNKCQNYTYTTKSGKVTYNPENDVIKQFLQRALIQIKASQDEVLASYGESCISDVSSCLASNNYDASNPAGTKSRIAINSCYSQIKTCMSVNGNVYGEVKPEALREWVTGIYSNVETYVSTDEITNSCAQITDQTECGQKWGYCMSGNTTSIITAGSLCTWTSDTTHPNGGTCTGTATCGSSSSSSTGTSSTSGSTSGSTGGTSGGTSSSPDPNTTPNATIQP